MARHHRTTIHLPHWRDTARHAVVPLCESTLIPLGLFALLLHTVGFEAGLWAALSWSGLAVAARLLRGRALPAILVISTLILLVRTAVGLWTGSALVYFLQPSAQNFLFAAALLVTLAGGGRPLLARLADDFVPMPEALTSRPNVQRFFRRVSLLWAAVFMINGVMTVTTLAVATVDDYLVVTTAGSYSVVALGIGISLWWFRASLAGEGVRLRWAPRRALA
ncbi:VC0807 family protein [Actinomycetospora cinnamomea]|uniref:Intracellular septation protein A n=1 Tax=Actinomycetospora cinnamomea TaxID=663609 RepID=A0A2U1F8T6_9PSEU|nr:VC0807 family protein [Actinomycetospora cinnamomea]PVZ08591.1 intracellular septation protein A [Actinomycetospora cinnamomea]